MNRSRSRTISGRVSLDLGYQDADVSSATARADPADAILEDRIEARLRAMNDEELGAFLRAQYFSVSADSARVKRE